MGDKLDKKITKRLPAVDPSRREAIKRIALGSVFAVPAVMTFSLNPANAASGIGCYASYTATGLSPARGGPNHPFCSNTTLPH